MKIPKRSFENGYIAIKKCKHGPLAYNINDMYIGKSLDIYGEWCEPELILLENYVLPGDLVIDVGACIGTHTIAFANMVGPGGFIFAFEPQRVNHNILCANVAINSKLNVSCVWSGASDLKGLAKVPLLNPNTPQNFGAINIESFDAGEPVQLIPIDDLKLKKCNLIKIDVEGMETKVIDGAEDTIEQYMPIIYTENNRTEGSERLLATLMEFAYQCYWHILDYYNPKNFFKNKVNIFKDLVPEVNVLALPKSEKAKNKNLLKVKNEKETWEDAVKRTRR